MNCTANSLLSAARHLRGIPEGLSRIVTIHLLCQWANAVPPGLTVAWNAPSISTEQYIFNFAGSYTWDGTKYLQTPEAGNDPCYIQYSEADGQYVMYGANGGLYYHSTTLTGTWEYYPDGGDPVPEVTI